MFLSFACPAAVPIIVHLLAQDDLMSRTMSGMATLFTLVSIFTAWKLHCTIRTALHLRFDNADLVAAVTAEKARVDASQRLEAEAEHRRREAEVLAELARTVNAALEVDTVLQRVTGEPGSCATAMGRHRPVRARGRGGRHLLLGRATLPGLSGRAD